MNVFYVYLHRRNDTNEIFYVGKGKGNRAYSQCRNRLWKAVHAECGGHTVEILFDNLQESEAYQAEIDVIAELKNFGIKLTNLTIGGGNNSGRIVSQETRLNLSNARRNMSPDKKKELCRKISELRIGFKFSEESKVKMSESAKKFFASEAGVERLKLNSIMGKDRFKDVEFRNKISNSLKAHHGTPEFRKKMSEIKLEHSKTPGYSKRMSDAQKGISIICSNGMIFEKLSHAIAWLKTIGINTYTSTLSRAAKFGRETFGFYWNFVSLLNTDNK